MKQQKEQMIINVDLMNEILFQENKIMKLNDCLNEMKLDEKKINTYREKIQKELKIIFRFCLTLLAFIILIIGIMFISYSELEQGNMKDWYTVCNSLVVFELLL